MDVVVAAEAVAVAGFVVVVVVFQPCFFVSKWHGAF